MKIILKEDMHNLGFKDEVVDVKPGYARNFLIPQGKAVIASESALKILAENQRQQAKKLEGIKKEAEAMATKLEGVQVEIVAKTSNTGRIYGSIGSAQVADALEALGFTDINRKMLQMTNAKEIGQYIAKVRLHKDVTVDVPVNITSETPIVAPAKPEEDEAAAETTEEEIIEAEIAEAEEAKEEA